MRIAKIDRNSILSAAKIYNSEYRKRTKGRNVALLISAGIKRGEMYYVDPNSIEGSG